MNTQKNLRYDSSRFEIQFVMKSKNWNQIKLSDHFNVSPGAISGAIKGDKKLQELRIKIVDLINETK